MSRCFGLIAGAVLTAAALGAPARATYYFDFDDIVTVKKNDVGLNFTVDYAGKANGNYTSKLSAIGSFTFNGVTNNGLTYNFNYALTNDSTYDSRIRSFGFDTSSSIAGLNGQGAFTYAYTNASYIEGTGTMDACFAAGSGCTQHASGGINDGATGYGSFAVTFGQVMESVDFSHFALKFLGVNPTVNGQDWGAGLGSVSSLAHGLGSNPITAPEPGTWMMLLGGFGLVGFAMRSRRARTQRRQIA